ncbi:winged helix-turn-helix domain-containing protein [Halalkalicoccus sp. NIPERK01]|uniref:helix-turn-helix transcriptional regulator n=1 Tax=Halalkalicoccus sp. NIPERK01 TaxID=3053469 RepID=UPI00256EC587|nr:MarR family transcriptional regulator [Halalkalicoccus sp. NIPERK01]MDL5360838.1 MarR family transcriptional regulator [Halalkalicoccus sp. NIPERK01]
MGPNTGSPIGDIAYLARSEHRVSTLVALADRPRSRSELRELVGVSSSTIRRTLSEFEDRNWIRKSGRQFEATPVGAYIASGMAGLIERVENERRLRDVWHWLPVETGDLRIDLFADAVVTVAEATDPYRPVNRFVSLLEATDRFRLLGSDLALFEPCRELFCRRVVDGMEAEIIDPPYVSKHVLSTYPDHFSKTMGSGNLTVWVHDEVPGYGLTLFDDRVSITGYTPDSGAIRVLVDTDAPEVREWAETTYAAYRRSARSLDALNVDIDADACCEVRLEHE